MMLGSCSLRGLHEAQAVVVEADSLRRSGLMYEDSSRLAMAVDELSKWQYIHPTDYARSQYLYGRMLRQKKDYLPAMQAFYAATQSISRDYEIKARSYDNMACISCVADELDMARELFQRSGEFFLKKGDSTAYVFSRNNIASTYTNRLSAKDALRMNDSLSSLYPDSIYELAFMETRLKALISLAQYDSALYYCDYLLAKYHSESWLYEKKMQAFSFLHQNDSATYYANYVIQHSNIPSIQSNAYYVLTNQDDTRTLEEIREASRTRADLHKVIESEQGRSSSAVEYYVIVNSRRPYRLLGGILCLLLLSVITTYSVLWSSKRRSLSVLLMKQKKLVSIHSKTAREQSAYYNEKLNNLSQQCDYLLRLVRSKKIDVSNYKTACKLADEHLFLIASKLKEKDKLKDTDIQMCILVLIGLNRPQIADILRYSENSIGKLKGNVAKSLGTSGKELRNYLMELAIGRAN